MNPYALIAELDPQRGAVYRRSVEAQRLEAVVVRDGDAAARVLESRGAPILLITDLSLPHTDGLSLITELRRISPPERSAIVVLCGFDRLRTAAWNLRRSLGIFEVSDKNVSDGTIDRLVAHALQTVTPAPAESRRTRQELEALVRRILHRVSGTFRVPMVVLSAELREERLLVAHMRVGMPRADALPWPVLQQVMMKREPLVVADVNTHPLFGIAPVTPSLQVGGFIAVPLITSEDRAVGAMSLLDFRPLTFAPEQIDALGEVARRIADELWTRHQADLAETSLTGYRTEQEWAELQRLALTDSLTGLFNRRAGEQALQREIAHARRSSFPLSLVLVDLDHLKEINDGHGHGAGDRALRAVANALTSVLRASDQAIRWGGDEFLALLPDATLVGAVKFAERIRAQIESQNVEGVGRLTISAGVAEVGATEDPEEALRRADAELYAAKTAGRGCVKGSAGTSSEV